MTDEIKWCDTRELQSVATLGYFTRDAGQVYARSWPHHEPEGGCHHANGIACRPLPKLKRASLYRLLEQRWNHPAYLLAYQPPAMPYRLGAEVFTRPGALARIGDGIKMQLMLMDVDAHGKTPAEVDAWFDSERPKLEALQAEHGCLVYRSRRGYRIVGVLPRPFEITSARMIVHWKRRYLSWVNYLGRAFTIGTTVNLDKEGIDGLCDWQRLQRLPHDLRTEDGVAEELEVLGDTACIGYWDPVLTEQDYAWAAETLGSLPTRSASTRRRRRSVTEPTPGDGEQYTGRTLLRILLEGRGLLGEQQEPGKWNVVCPMETQHSSSSIEARPREGQAGDSDTVLWERGGRIGNIHCSHTSAGHSRFTLRDWLECFESDAIAAAREECGVRDPNAEAAPGNEAFYVADLNDWTLVGDVVARHLGPHRFYRGDWYIWSAEANVYERHDVPSLRALAEPILRQIWSRAMVMPRGRRGQQAEATPEEVIRRWKGETKKDKEVVRALEKRPGTLLSAEAHPPFLISERSDGLGTRVPLKQLVPFKDRWVGAYSSHEYEPAPDVFLTRTLGCYWDSDLKRGNPPHEWLKFLSSQWGPESEGGNDPASVALLQEWMGTMIAAETRHHKLLYFDGPVRSGKGTLFRLLKAMLGRSYGSFEGLLDERFDLEPLVDKTLAVNADIRWRHPKDMERAVGRLLKLTGGDDIEADRKGRSKVALQPMNVLMGSNVGVSLSDAGGAVVSRMSILRSSTSYLGREDRGLGEKLQKEIPAIAAWALEGFKRLASNGFQFTKPPYHGEAVMEVEEASNPASVFLSDCLEVGPDLWVVVRDLQAAYATHAKENNRGQLSSNSLGRALKNWMKEQKATLRKDYKTISKVRHKAYLGVGLRADAMGMIVSRIDQQLLEQWLTNPRRWTPHENVYGQTVFQYEAWSSSTFKISDAAVHGFGAAGERRHRDDATVSRILASLGLVEDENGVMFFPARVRDPATVHELSRRVDVDDIDDIFSNI
jgi:hypothetical protein